MSTKSKGKQQKQAPKEDQPSMDELQESQRLLEEELIDTKERLANAEATIARQVKVVSAAKASSFKPLTVQIDGDDYLLKAPALFIDGKKLNADEIAGDSNILSRLLKNGSEALEKL